MRRLMCTATSTTFLLLATAISAQVTCQNTRQVCQFKQDGVTPDINCPKVPTSLQVTDGTVASDVGYYNDGTACGIDVNTKKPCGNKFGTTLCGLSAGDPDPWVDVPAPVGTEICDLSGELDWDCIDTQFMSAPPPPQFQAAVLDHVQKLVPTLTGDPSIRRLVQSTAKWRSLHVKARVAVSVPRNAAGTPATSLAEYEYWEQGDRYHVRTDLDPALGFVDVPEIAYDGRFYQLVIGSHRSLLSLGTQDSRTMPLILSNPFLQQFAFMDPSDATSCPACELRLSDLHAVAAKLAAAPPSAQSSQPDMLEIPGREVSASETQSHVPALHRVQLDSQHRVSKILSLTKDQRLVSTVEISDWSAGGSVSFPRKVVVQRFDGVHGEPLVSILFAVDKVEVDGQLPESDFRIAQRAFPKIWNSDHGHWFRYKAMSTEGLCQK